MYRLLVPSELIPWNNGTSLTLFIGYPMADILYNPQEHTIQVLDREFWKQAIPDDGFLYSFNGSTGSLTPNDIIESNMASIIFTDADDVVKYTKGFDTVPLHLPLPKGFYHAPNREDTRAWITMDTLFESLGLKPVSSIMHTTDAPELAEFIQQ